MGPAPEDALRALVHQFPRPLDLLRELVQNALDAGSPEVHVRVSADPCGVGRALLRVSVADTGEGMDAVIVEEQLTRLFASSKAGDPSRIGEYGVGFASVFAIRPELVLVRTGRHGEAWELAFHPDGTYDQTRLDEILTGTEVVLLKEIPDAEAPRWSADCRAALLRWCEHADAPVWFEDALVAAPGAAPAPAGGAEDHADAGWAALLDAAGAPRPPRSGAPERLSRPMDLTAPLQLRHREGGVEVLVGVGGEPSCTWLCRGLTLLSTPDPACFGAAAPRLAGLQVKVRSDGLSHTLTRDSVSRDAAWEAAVGASVRAVDALADLALERHRAATDDAALLETLGWLAPLWGTPGLPRRARGVVRLPQVGRPAAGLSALEARRPRGRAWLVGAPGDPLAAAAAREETVLIDDPGVRAAVGALSDRPLEPVGAAWVDPRPWPADLSPPERALYEAACAILREAGRTAVPCELPAPAARAGRGAHRPDAAPDVALVEHGHPHAHRRDSGEARSAILLIRVSHPLPAAWLRAFPEHPRLAARGLAHAILLELGAAEAAEAVAAGAAGPDP